MKSILLLAHDDQGQEARLQVALDVTRALGGHLTCLDVIAPPVVLAYDGYGSVAEARLIESEHEREAANRSRLEARLAREDVAWSWHETTGFREPAIEAAADLADLIVLSSRLDAREPSELRQLAGRVAENARCPVLAVPNAAKGLQVTGAVLVAWDGSREADKALRYAVPLLALASEVILFVVDEPEGIFAAEPAAQYLSRQGVHARIDLDDRKAAPHIHERILDSARTNGAAYIVMGAYGHSPILEKVFGGVTRSMLAHSDLPLLLAH